MLKKIPYFKDRDLGHGFASLTKVLNREAIMAYIEWLIKENHSFSLFLVDIDKSRMAI